MKLEEYNKDFIDLTSNLKISLTECKDEFEKLCNKIEKVLSDYESKMKSYNDKEVEDPCVECLVKPACQFKMDVETVKNMDPKLSDFYYRGEYCIHKMRSALIKGMKTSMKMKDFASFHKDIMIEIFLTEPGHEVLPYEWRLD